MTQYIRVSNAGLICIDDLQLIGSSSKRDKAGKIGMFGSGWKYALAWLIRNDATPIIYSGEDQIVIGYNYRLHRDNPVRVITVNDVETSLTAEMGPQWEGWMAFREIFSNAIDEGEHDVNFGDDNTFGTPGRTNVFIPITKDLFNVMEQFDRYFSYKRKVHYENDVARIFLRDEKEKPAFYRKGIRCYDARWWSQSDHGIFDFDFKDISINEDRLCQHYDLDKMARKFMESCGSVHVVKMMLERGKRSFICHSVTDTIKEAVQMLKAEGKPLTTDTLSRAGSKGIVVPMEMFKPLMDEGLVDNPLSSVTSMMDGYEFIEDPTYDTREIRYYLSEVIPHVEVKVGTGSFGGAVRCSIKEDDTAKYYTFWIKQSEIEGLSKDGYSTEMKNDPKHIAAYCICSLDGGSAANLVMKLFN